MVLRYSCTGRKSSNFLAASGAARTGSNATLAGPVILIAAPIVGWSEEAAHELRLEGQRDLRLTRPARTTSLSEEGEAE
jgi:hypothetical protein